MDQMMSLPGKILTPTARTLLRKSRRDPDCLLRFLPYGLRMSWLFPSPELSFPCILAPLDIQVSVHLPGDPSPPTPKEALQYVICITTLNTWDCLVCHLLLLQKQRSRGRGLAVVLTAAVSGPSVAPAP